MGFIKIEKERVHNNKYFNTYNDKEYPKNDNQSPIEVTPSETALTYDIPNDGMYKSNDNINTMNKAEEYSYDFASDHVHEEETTERLKVERDIITTCLSTFFKMTILSAIIIFLLYLGISYFNTKVEIFPYQSSYTATEFNDYLKRSFILLFLILSFGCSMIMILSNAIVNNQFKKHYLSKINIYIYDVFISIINATIYCIGGWLMFLIVDNLYNKFLFWQTAGSIMGSVNIDTINIFKYVITSVIAIFIVISSFSIWGIVHKSNKFVFEDVK